MKNYGYIRVSSYRGETSPDIQEQAIRAHFTTLGVADPIIRAEELGTSGVSTSFKERPEGAWLLSQIEAGDRLVVAKLDRLGRSIIDILHTVKRLQKRGVQIVVLSMLGQTVDLSTQAGLVLVTMTALFAEIEATLIGDRLTAGKRHMKEMGFATGPSTGWGQRRERVSYKGKVRNRLVWDDRQLQILAELSRRLGRREKMADIAADFWRRGLVDQTGRPWGTIVPADPNVPAMFPYRRFREAMMWWHRMKRQGLLPTPYGELAALDREPARFSLVPRKYKPRKKKPVPADVRESWTLDQWREWNARQAMGEND